MITATRRALVVICALGAAVVLLRPQLSEALVVRGDDLAYRGNGARSEIMYERALAFDLTNTTALDRLAFHALCSGRDEQMEHMVTRLSKSLDRRSDLALLQDRAMLELKLRRYSDAERDFVSYARTARDARAATFAGFAALRAGHPRGARSHFTSALSYDASFAPARSALERLPQ